MPITEASNRRGLDREGSACCHHGPGTWKRLKLLDATHLDLAPGSHAGAVFGASREVPSSAVSLPQYFLSLFPRLRSEVLSSKN